MEQEEYPLVNGLDDERGKVLVINGCYQCHYRVKDVRTPYNDWVCRKSGYDIRERSEYVLPRWCPLQDVGGFLTGKKIINALVDGLISVKDMQSALLGEIMRENKGGAFTPNYRSDGRPSLFTGSASGSLDVYNSYQELGLSNPRIEILEYGIELGFDSLQRYTEFVVKYAPKIK